LRETSEKQSAAAVIIEIQQLFRQLIQGTTDLVETVGEFFVNVAQVAPARGRV
jgi:hypothetical protein